MIKMFGELKWSKVKEETIARMILKKHGVTIK
jgi:hypothetical protein